MGTRSQKAAVNLLMLSKHINTFNTGKMFCFVFLAATSCSIPPSVFWSAGPQKSPHPLAAGQVSLQRFVCIHVKWLQQWCIPGTCMTSYTCTILLGHDTKDCWLMVGAVLGVAFSNKAWILDLMHWGRKVFVRLCLGTCSSMWMPFTEICICFQNAGKSIVRWQLNKVHQDWMFEFKSLLTL